MSKEHGENSANYARDCDGCGCGLSFNDLAQARTEAPDYIPESKRVSAGIQYFCEPCRESMWERQQNP